MKDSDKERACRILWKWSQPSEDDSTPMDDIARALSEVRAEEREKAYVHEIHVRCEEHCNYKRFIPVEGHYRAINRARAEEREACAKVAEKFYELVAKENSHGWVDSKVPKTIAKAIRERGGSDD